MSVSRVTQTMMKTGVLNNLSKQTRSLLALQLQLSTGQRLNAPSDDPIDVRRAIDTRTLIQVNEQYVDNIEMTRPQHTETSTMLEAVLNVIQRADELTLQGANSTNGETQLEAIAQEVNQLLETVLEYSNQQTGNRYIFSGTRTQTAAFSATRNGDGEITAVTYEGNSEAIDLSISDGVTVRINETGDDVFQGTVDIFQTLIDIRDNLRAGDIDSLGGARLQELEAAQDQVMGAITRVGAVQNRVDEIEDQLEDSSYQNQALYSQLVDIDYADLIVNLNAQQNAYQAALSAASYVLQPSLLDYM